MTDSRQARSREPVGPWIKRSNNGVARTVHPPPLRVNNGAERGEISALQPTLVPQPA